MKKKEISIGLALAFLISTLGFLLLYYNKIAPGVYIAGVNVGAKTKTEAIQLLNANISKAENIEVIIESNQVQQFPIPLASIDHQHDLEGSVARGFALGKSGNLLQNIATLTGLIGKRVNLPLEQSLDESKLQEHVATIAGNTTVEAVYPKITLVSGSIVVDRGQKGSDFDSQDLISKINSQLAFARFSPIVVKLQEIDPTLTTEAATAAKERAEKLIDKSIAAKLEFETTTLSKQTLFDLLNPAGGIYFDNLKTQVEKIAEAHNREAINPVFEFADGRVKEFQPAKPGIAVKQQELAQQIAEAINSLEENDTKVVEITIAVDSTEPKIATNEVNDLGIKELIGRGTSRYRGSISSRVYNVDLAASRVNGVLVPPGETFSFNNALGDVSKLTGYREAYVIQNGKTVLGDGGGVCQVSSTLFRAVLNAGLPITERRAHSYRVGYYEQESSVGFDATVFSPTTDLKFKNDTPAHILVQTISDPKNYSLVFEIYGTSDGRVATVTKPVVTNVIAPAEDLYVDDPTLPTGQIKQVEHKAWGAQSTFHYEVKRGDEVIYKKTFVSTYRPWQAVFMRGTGPAQ